MQDQSGLSLLEVLIVLFILALLAGLPTFVRLPNGASTVSDIESFVAMAVADTMASGRDGLLYTQSHSLSYGAHEIAWDNSVGRLSIGEGDVVIVLYTNGTSSKRLALDVAGASIGLLTVPRW